VELAKAPDELASDAQDEAQLSESGVGTFEQDTFLVRRSGSRSRDRKGGHDGTRGDGSPLPAGIITFDGYGTTSM
jgi:hypothetical protein